jgi:hypothetical protein
VQSCVAFFVVNVREAAARASHFDHGRRRCGGVEGIWGVQTRRHGWEPPSQRTDQAPEHVNCDRPGPRLNEFHATLFGQRRNRPGQR